MGGSFKCYDPISLQSYMTDFNETMDESHLRDRFDGIGVMNQLAKSACVISIRYTGFVSPMCDCTSGEHKRRRLLNDHGVKHHGATFNLTNSQKSKIAKLTQLNSLLYQQAKLAFTQQVLEIEEEFDVVLCENPIFKKT